MNKKIVIAGGNRTDFKKPLSDPGRHLQAGYIFKYLSLGGALENIIQHG
jgi:hypothetical protein